MCCFYWTFTVNESIFVVCLVSFGLGIPNLFQVGTCIDKSMQLSSAAYT
jgi:hypothetical protein